jgi:acetyl-CoA carboxylase carboxyl transferase subunit alpha
MHPEKRGWGAFGAFSLNGELPSEKPIAILRERMEEILESRNLSQDDRHRQISDLQAQWDAAAHTVYSNLEPWETVFVARHPNRPLVGDYIHHAVHEFCELHGDRNYGDDSAIVTGLGWIGPHRVMIIGQNRGRTLAERVDCNFGCPHPEGYRKALAKMRFAAKYRIPIVSLIDTPGAYPGMESEQRGIAQAIAANLQAMPQLRVPLISVVIGEGGSGGALGIAVSDKMAMLEHSIFSVISPEGCAAILWKTSAHAKDAASALRMRASDLLQLGLIDEVIGEPLGGAHRNHALAAQAFQEFVVRQLDQLKRLSPDDLLSRRYQRLRTMGCCYEQVFSNPPDAAPQMT